MDKMEYNNTEYLFLGLWCVAGVWEKAYTRAGHREFNVTYTLPGIDRKQWEPVDTLEEAKARIERVVALWIADAGLQQ